MSDPASLKKTALFGAHQKLGARLVEFGGWQMPVQYTSIVDEHKAVRESAGVFDISHMGEFFVSGHHARVFLNGLLTNDVDKLSVGQGQYTLMLNDEGGVIDDLILYRLEEEKFLLVVNAAKIEEDWKWILGREAATNTPDVWSENASANYSALALQGPRSLQIARALLGAGWPMPEHNQITSYSWNCQPILAARTGYTGEDGVELFFPSEIAEAFFAALLEAGRPLGLKASGLGARDTLRLEACLPLNGNDLTPNHTPIEAGLGAFVSLAKAADFPGKDVLLKQKANGVNEKLVAFRLTQGGPPPRAHYGLFLGETRVGEVTSGAPSPTLACGIGLAYVETEFTEPGTKLELEVRGSRVPVEVVKKPFYKRAK
ncbi:MAG TPA: glycine cleavage system aminomethyltransferase GcvT [Candidatus Methylacidiphilales bacterium]|jgi:aminomethyltransferase|nr:glycine cleavage system aminomethyltransferase GcvT [Candidatus Methylacidiphilales bacterium]